MTVKILQRLLEEGEMAGAEGFEPSALGFGDRCSNQAELRAYGRAQILPHPIPLATHARGRMMFSH